MHEPCPHAMTCRTCAICWPAWQHANPVHGPARPITDRGRDLALYSRDHSAFDDRSPSVRRGPGFVGLWSGGKRGKGWG